MGTRRHISRHVARRGARRTMSFAALTGLLCVLAACSVSTDRTLAVSSVGGAPGADLVLPRQLSDDARAAQMVAHLSLDDKLGQMIVVQYTDTTYTPLQAAIVKPFHPGGVILYGYAMGSAPEVHDLLAAGQHDSPIPMFTFTDLEGGVVDRLEPYLGYRMSAPDMAASGNPTVAEQQGEKTARDLLSFGFNADLAPVTDVSVVLGPDQWGRTFGSTPDPVITYAGAWLSGLQRQGVVGSLKHFPGLGAATTDAHTSLPVVTRTRDELEATELAPYRALIAKGQVHMIMSTDVLMPALDPTYPAELSRPIMTGILRDELHYDGVAVTDALYMAGISDHWSFAQAATLSIEAGNDMIMAPWTPGMVQDILNMLKQALASGQLSMDQVDNSVRRIIALKMRFHLLPGPAPITPGLHAEPPLDAALPSRATA